MNRNLPIEPYIWPRKENVRYVLKFVSNLDHVYDVLVLTELENFANCWHENSLKIASRFFLIWKLKQILNLRLIFAFWDWKKFLISSKTISDLKTFKDVLCVNKYAYEKETIAISHTLPSACGEYIFFLNYFSVATKLNVLHMLDKCNKNVLPMYDSLVRVKLFFMQISWKNKQ